MAEDPRIKILFVEDIPADAELAEREFRKNGFLFESRRVDTESAFLESLDSFAPDIVVSDYSMPAFDGMSALLLTKARDPFLPFILLTGSMNEDTAVSCIKAGASDYVIKEHMSRLTYAVREAIERRKMQEKAAEQDELLRQSEERYRSFFMNCNVAMLILDTENLTIQDANAAAVEFYGWPRDGLIGKSMAEINTLGIERLRELAGEVVVHGRTHFRFMHRRSGGRITDVESHSGPISLGGKTYLLSVIHDISERVVAERERDALASKLAHYLSTSPTVTYSLRLEGERRRSEWISENVTAMLGYSIDEALERDWWFDNLFPADRAFALKGFAELMKNGNYVQDYRFLRKDRSIVWLRDEMRLLHVDEAPVEIIGTLTEVTEQKRAEGDIRLKSAALEAADNAVTITDRGGTIEWMNGAFAALTGYSFDEALGKNTRDLLKSGKQSAEFYESLWSTISAGRVWRGELVNRRKSGELYTEEMTITPVMDASHRIEHFIAIKNDVTERVLAKRRLESSLLQKDALLREVHHRVKNNMQIIISLLSLALEDDPASPYRRSLDEVMRRIKSMAIVHEYFYESEDLARIDFASCLKALANFLIESEEENGVRPELVFAADEVLLSLEQAIPAGLIVSEFISNALRYAFPAAEDAAALRISLRRLMGGELAIEVKDNGIGLPSGFDPEKTDSLGLKLVGLLSDQLYGTVSYYSDGGTSATLCFPLAAAPAR